MNAKLKIIVLLVLFFACIGWGKVYFVQITDTHFGKGDHGERTREIVRRINALPMDIRFVVHSGDIFADNIKDCNVVRDAVETLSGIEAPFYIIPGNHDIDEDDVEATVKIYNDNFGPLAWSADCNEFQLLVLFTEPLVKDYEVEGYDGFGWLEKELGKEPDKVKIVVHHTASAVDFYDNEFHKNWDDENEKKWRRLISENNVGGVLTGHFHREEFHWIDDTPVYVAGPVAGYLGRQATYRIYCYDEGKLSYSTVYVEEIDHERY